MPRGCICDSLKLRPRVSAAVFHATRNLQQWTPSMFGTLDAHGCEKERRGTCKLEIIEMEDVPFFRLKDTGQILVGLLFAAR